MVAVNRHRWLQDVTYSGTADYFQSKHTKGLLGIFQCQKFSYLKSESWKSLALVRIWGEPFNQNLLLSQGTAGRMPEYM